MPVEEFIYSEEYCGGIRNGKKLKAVVAGGSSVPILPTELILKTAKGEPRIMTYESLEAGIKYTLKKLAEESSRSYNAVRQEHLLYKAERNI